MEPAARLHKISEKVDHCYLCGNDSYLDKAEVIVNHGTVLKKVQCQNCSLIYANVRPKFEWMIGQYSQPSIVHHEQTDRFRAIRYRNIGNILQQFTKGNDLLDIGSGTGLGLVEFVKGGWNVIGLEPSARAEGGRKQGLEIIPKTIEQYNEVSDQQFDAITLIHVLEHLYDPKKVVSEIVRKVRDNGVFYIEVPDAQNYGLTDGSHLAHVSYFNFENLCALLAEFNFRPYVRVYSKTVPFGPYHLGVIFIRDFSIDYSYKTPSYISGLDRPFTLSSVSEVVFTSPEIETALQDFGRIAVERGGQHLQIQYLSKPKTATGRMLKKIINISRLLISYPFSTGSFILRKLAVQVAKRLFTDPNFQKFKYQKLVKN